MRQEPAQGRHQQPQRGSGVKLLDTRLSPRERSQRVSAPGFVGDRRRVVPIGPIRADSRIWKAACAPAGDADGEAIKRLQHAASLNGAAPVIRRLPLGADKLTAEYKIRDTAGKLMAVHKRFEGPLSKDMPWFQPNGTKGLGRPEKGRLAPVSLRGRAESRAVHRPGN